MPRLNRFADNRFVGVRSEMRVYDCDDPDQFEELSTAVEAGDLLRSNGLQTFGPDTVVEARNRGFRPAGT